QKDRLAIRIALNRLGLLHFKMSDYEKARTYFYDSWMKCKDKKDNTGRWINAVNLANVAAVKLSRSHDASLAEQIIDILKQELENNSNIQSTPEERLVLLNSIGTLWTLYMRSEPPVSGLQSQIKRKLNMIQQLGQAEAYLEEGLTLAADKNFQKQKGVFQKNLAEVYLLTGDDSLAMQMLRDSYESLEAVGETTFLWRILYRMGTLGQRAWEDAPDFLNSNALSYDAASYYDLAMTRLEEIAVNEENSEEWLSDRQERIQLYSDAAVAMAERGEAELALATLERGKQKAVSDIMARRPPELRRERHKIVWGNVRYLRRQLQEIHEKIREGERKRMKPRQLRALRRQQEKYQDEYEDLMLEVREEDHVLSYLMGAEPVDLEGIQELLPADNVILNYLLDKDKIWVWLISREFIQLKTIPVAKHEIEEKVNLLYHGKGSSLWSDVQKDLYRLLLSPLEEEIRGYDHLIIVPDGCLWEFDFSLIHDGTRLLGDSKTFSNTPSVVAYRLAHERRRINQTNLLYVGDVKDLWLSDRSVRESVWEIHSGLEATEERFRKGLANADLVHVARWSLFNEMDPLTSAMVFLKGGSADGYIRAHELFSWEIRASMVVLPSQAAGHDRGWYGPLSFVYGLLYSGVPSVINTLWPVPAEVKKQFFETFYHYVREMSISQALQKTRQVIRSQMPHPRNWAGFQLIGSEGMGPDERLAFAGDNMIKTVLQARAYQERQDFAESVEKFEVALDMAIAIDNKVAIQNIYQELVSVCVNGNMFEKAVNYQSRRQRAAESEGDPNAIWSNLELLVALYQRSRQYDEAAHTKIAAIEILKETGSDKIASSFEELASLYAMGRKFDEATRWIEEARQNYEASNDVFGQARALIRKGRFQLEADNYWGAQQDLSEGIRLISELESLSNENTTILFWSASAHQLHGQALERLSRYEEALAVQEKGINLFTTLNQPRQVAQGHQHLANLYWKMGDYRKGLSYQNQAMKTFESQGDKRNLSIAYSTQGLIHMSLGDLAEAKRSEDKALALTIETASLLDQAAVLKNLGLIATQEGKLDNAYQYFKRATQIDSAQQFRRGLAYDYRNLGSLLIRLDRSRDALKYLQDGLSLSKEIGDQGNVVQCLFRMGQAYNVLDNENAALTNLDSALAGVQDIVLPELSWRILRERALTLQKMGREQDALDNFIEAVDIVEQMRAELKVEAFKEGFFENKMDLYKDVVQHLLSMKRDGEAFDFVERGKSRNFIDLLGNQQLVLNPASKELLGKEKAARMAVQEARDRLAWFKKQPEETGAVELENWGRELEIRQAAYSALLIDIQAENPELASMVSVDPWTTDQVQDILPEKSALIEYYVTEDQLFIWMIRSDYVGARTLELKQTLLEETIRRFRDSIKQRLTTDLESRQLYKWLIEPFEDELFNVGNIILVPHKTLHYLPFAALQGETVLIEKFTLSTVPSATVMAYCLEKGNSRSLQEDETTVLAMSNPNLGDPNLNLPFAEKEVKALRRSFEDVTAFFQDQATEKKLKDNASQYSVIHFACHGTFEPGAPMFSALLLKPEEEEDGRLEVHEIFGLSLNCDLVTLSACETGLGHITGGDDIIGLARSFIFAGTPSIITSLWKVDDLATAVMIKRFYRYLRSGDSRAESLRKAQILVKNSINSHPAAWAAFGLTGDFR
ncbi:hypothetical protein BVY01_05075, partial [bacterium I07]